VRPAALSAALRPEEELTGAVRCDVPALGATVRALARGASALSTEPFLVIERAPAGALRLFCRGELVYETTHEGNLLSCLDLHLDAETPRLLEGRVAFHAALAADEGRGIVVAGASMAGKSTLAAALVDAGLAYGTDDVALVDEDGAVRPCPRPLRLRPGGAALLGPVSDRFERLSYAVESGATADYLVPRDEATATGPVRVRVLALLERRQSGFEARRVSAAEATARLLPHRLGEADPALHLARARALVEGARERLLLLGGDPRTMARELGALLGSSLEARVAAR